LDGDSRREGSVVGQLQRCDLGLWWLGCYHHSAILVVDDIAERFAQLSEGGLRTNASHLGQDPITPDAGTDSIAHQKERVERR